MEQISPIGKAALIVGGLTKLARMLEVAPPTVHEWKTGKRPVPAARCKSIVRVTNGEVTLKDLRPNDWEKIWPDPCQAVAAVDEVGTHPAHAMHLAQPAVADCQSIEQGV